MVEQNKDDYYDVNFDKKTESPESMTFFFQIITYLFKDDSEGEGRWKLQLISIGS